jgi:hypothetical protein
LITCIDGIWLDKILQDVIYQLNMTVMKTKMITSTNRITLTFVVTLLMIYGAGCDSSVDSGNGGDAVTLSGRVAEHEDPSGRSGEHSGGSSVADMNGVEGAVVTAVAVHADGSVSALDGQATTNAAGEFTFVAEGEGASDHVRVIAEADGGFEASAIVNVRGRSSVNIRPVTSASHAQARVFLAARAEAKGDTHSEGATKTDVSVMINSDVAADINSSAQSTANLGVAIANAVKAQSEFSSRTDANVDFSSVGSLKLEAYSRFATALSASTSSASRASAYANLEDDYVKIFSESGVDLVTQAKLHQTGSALMLQAGKKMSGNVETGIRKQADLVHAHATALAVEAIMEAEGASQARLDALASARAELVADIRTATSVEAVAEAKAEYRASAQAIIEAHYSISSAVTASAESQIETSFTVLVQAISNLSVFLGNAAEVTAQAFASFYASAETDAKVSFRNAGMSEAEAEAAAQLTVLLYALS